MAGLTRDPPRPAARIAPWVSVLAWTQKRQCCHRADGRPGAAASAPWMARARVRAGCPDRGKSSSRPPSRGPALLTGMAFVLLPVICKELAAEAAPTVAGPAA